MVDAWTGPTARSSQTPGQPTDGIDALLRKFEAIKTELSDATNNLLKAAGVRVEPGTLRILDNLAVDGSATFAGDTEIGGNARITGTLSLPAGIIDNEALANPFGASLVDAEGTNFGITTTYIDYVVESLVVPVGFTRALVQGLGTLFFLNATPNVDYVRARVRLESGASVATGRSLLSMIGPDNGSVALTPNRFRLFEGLTGGDPIVGRMQVRSDFADLPSHVANVAGMSMQAIFLR